MEIGEIFSKIGYFILLVLLFAFATVLVFAQIAVTLGLGIVMSGILDIPAVASFFS